MTTNKFIMLMLITILLVGAVTAFEFDNVKDYNEELKEVTITNSFGLGSEIAKIKLNTPLVNKVGVGYVKVAEFTINQYDDSYLNALQLVEFFDVKRGMREKQIDFDYKYKTIVSQKGTEEECSVDNKTSKITCQDVSYSREVVEWKDYNGKDMLKGEVTIGIFTYTKQGDTIEWIPTYYGIEIGEWAIWTAGLNTNLEAYYKLNESSGAIVDATGNVNDGTNNGAGYSGTGKIGTALDFEQGDSHDFVNLTDGAVASEALDLDADFSICAWINPESIPSTMNILGKRDGAGYQFEFRVDTTGDLLSLLTTGGSVKATTYAIQTGVYQFVCVTRDDDGNTTFYVNGTEDASVASKSVTHKNTDVYIGSSEKSAADGLSDFDGLIDEVGVWSRILTPAEITQLWNGGTGITYVLNYAPSVTLNSPIDTYNSTSNAVTFNCTATDESGIINVSLYIDGSINETNTSAVNGTYIFSKTILDGNHNWTCGAYDDENSSTTTATRDFTIARVLFDQLIYNSTTYKSKAEGYGTYVTADGTETITGYLIWNGTSSLGTKVGTNSLANFSKGLTMSDVGNNVPVYWSVHHGSSVINSTTFYVNVSDVDVVTLSNATCGAGLSLARKFNFSTEVDQNALTGMGVDYNFKYGISNNTAITEAGNVPIATDIYVCINTTISPTYYVGYGELQYEKSSYVDRRHYVFVNSTLTNTSINSTLIDLNSSLATSFLFTIQDSDLNNYENVYLTLNRWYPEDDEYKVAEMAKTDNKGQTIMKVEVEDVDYRVGVYYPNGTAIYLANPIRFACIESPCTYNLRVPDDAGADWENWVNLENSLVFNSTTGIFTLTYSDPSQATSEIRLEIFRETGTASVSICEDTASSWTGVLTCNVSGYTGMLRAVAYRTASPEITINALLEQISSDGLTGDAGLFITLLLVIVFALIGVVSPILSIILTILAFIPAMVFGITPLAIMLVFAAMGVIVIHFMKRSLG